MSLSGSPFCSCYSLSIHSHCTSVSSCLTANQCWQACFHFGQSQQFRLRCPSTPVLVFVLKQSWPKCRQLQARGSVGRRSQWRDKEMLTWARVRGPVAETSPVFFCQLKHIFQSKMFSALTGELLFHSESLSCLTIQPQVFKWQELPSPRVTMSSCSAPSIPQQFTLRHHHCLHHFISQSVILSHIYLKLKLIPFAWWCIYSSPGRTHGDTLALNLVGMNTEQRCLALWQAWPPLRARLIAPQAVLMTSH